MNSDRPLSSARRNIYKERLVVAWFLTATRRVASSDELPRRVGLLGFGTRHDQFVCLLASV
jgi:hypothetical protein